MAVSTSRRPPGFGPSIGASGGFVLSPVWITCGFGSMIRSGSLTTDGCGWIIQNDAKAITATHAAANAAWNGNVGRHDVTNQGRFFAGTLGALPPLKAMLLSAASSFSVSGSEPVMSHK